MRSQIHILARAAVADRALGVHKHEDRIAARQVAASCCLEIQETGDLLCFL